MTRSPLSLQSLTTVFTTARNTLIMLVATLALAACGGSDDAGDPGKSSCLDGITLSTIGEEEARLDQQLAQMAGNNSELVLRTAQLGQVYRLGSFLVGDNSRRTVDTTSIELPAVALTTIAFSTGQMAARGNSSSNSAMTVIGAWGLSVEISRQSGRELAVQSSLAITDLQLRELNNTQEIIDDNIADVPDATGFVYGVYEGRVRTEVAINASCLDGKSNAVQVGSEYYNTHFEQQFQVNSSASTDSKLVIESSERIPIAFLIKPIDSDIPVPLNLSATVEAGPQIQLQWDPAQSISRYRVYFSQVPGFSRNDAGVQTIDVTGTSLTLTQNLVLGESWYFRVAALSGGTPGNLSESLSVTIPAGPPQQALTLEATALGNGSVRLAWSPPDGNAAIEYSISRRSGSGDWSEIASLAASNPQQSERFRQREYVDAAVSLNTSYDYQIQYSNLLSPPLSPLSNTATVTTVPEVVIVNEPPVAVPGSHQTVDEGETVQLNGSASYDPDNTAALTYSWEPSPTNPFAVSLNNPTSATPTFVAPEVSEATVELSFKLTVSDSIDTDVDYVAITVVNLVGGGTQPPVARLTASSLQVFEGDEITLDASSSSHPENLPLTFDWVQTTQTVDYNLGISEETGSSITFNAPFAVEDDVTISVSVLVSDGSNVRGASVDILVQDRGVEGNGLQLGVEPSESPALPGERTHWQLVVTNASDFRRDDVVLETRYPYGPLARLVYTLISDSGACSGSYCDADLEPLVWQLGTLQPGEAKAVSIAPFVAAETETGTAITLNATASDSLGGIADGAGTVTVGSSRVLQLASALDASTTTPGGVVNLELSYGFTQTSAQINNAVIQFSLPEGTQLRYASAGYTLANGVVSWTIPTLLPGDTGEVSAELLVADTLKAGDTLVVASELRTADSSQKTTAESLIWLSAAPPAVEVRSHFSHNPVEPGETFVGSFHITNNSSETLEGAHLRLRHETPYLLNLNETLIGGQGECIPSNCNNGEWIDWTVPTLAPGATHEASFVATLKNAETLDAGTLIKLRPWISYGDTRWFVETPVLKVTQDRQLEVVVNTASTPSLAGEPFDYRVQYQLNAESTQSTDTRLSLQLPEGVTFGSASNGGTYDGRRVNWTLGNLLPGAATGEQTVTVTPTSATVPAGLYKAIARIRDTEGRASRAEQVQSVSGSAPLTLELSLASTPVQPGASLPVLATVANQSTFKRSDVQLKLRYPPEFANYWEGFIGDGADCAGNAYCDVDEEFVIWNIGDLAAQTSLTLELPAPLGTGSSDNTLSVSASLTDSAGSEVHAARNAMVLTGSEPVIAMAAGVGPVAPGDLFTMAIFYRVPEAASAAAVVAELPAGASYISASGSATYDAATHTVAWQLGDLASGSFGELSLTLQADATQPAGTVLPVETSFTHGGSGAAKSRAATVMEVETTRLLEVDISSATETLTAGVASELTLTATNLSGFPRSNLVLQLRYPPEFASLANSAITGGACNNGSYCDVAGEPLRFEIASLGVGESVAFTFTPAVKADTPAGTSVLLSLTISDSTARAQTRTRLLVGE